MVIARARSLWDGGQPADAVNLLTQHRSPAAREIDLEILRMAPHLGATDIVQDICGDMTRRAEDLPPGARRIITDALILVGQDAMALPLIRRALTERADLHGLSPREQMVLFDSVSAGGDERDLSHRLQQSARRGSTVADHNHRVAYVSCPKNGCTVLKATIVMNSDRKDAYLKGGETIHQFCAKLPPPIR